jgi:ketosteroid isomerase-like protein
MQNLEIVKQIYADFGAGNVPGILARLRDDVAWEHEGSGHGVPWLLPGKGKAHVGRFFASLVALEFKRFEVVAVLGEGDLVVAIVSSELVVKATGKRIVEPGEVHCWRFDGEGRVKAFGHVVDTHQHLMALT